MQGLKVLIVRAVKPGDSLLPLLTEQGCEVEQLPVMSIEPVEQAELDRFAEQLRRLRAIDMAVFVSRNAVDQGVRLLKQGCQSSLATITCFAVGDTTADQLKRHGFNPRVPANQLTSEGLLALPELQEVVDKTILVFKGHGGRALLEQQLIARGAKVVELSVYRRAINRQHSLSIKQLLADKQINAIIVHSAELLMNVLDIAESCKPEVQALPLIVPSERVRRLAEEQGCQQVVISATARADDMVSALRGWYSNQG